MTIQNSLRFGAIACMAVFGLAASEHHGLVKFGGLPLPGATVTASQGDKKAAAVTDAQGIYSFADLADGVWSMQVEMLCFTTVKREIAVAPDAPAAEWEMKMMSLDDIKTVAPPPPPPSAAPASTPGANASQNGGSTAAPQPAAAAAPAAKPASKGKSKGQPATAASQTGFQRTDVNASEGASAAAPDSGGSMGADASQGASEAMVVNGSTSNGVERRAFGNARKGPGSLFNGNFMSSESNSALNARNFSLTGQNSEQPAYNNAVFGGQLGGPLWIPHVLRRNGQFYIGYQGSRNRSATTNPTLMPNALERSGDFSQAVNASGLPVSIFDPQTGSPFPGNVIPQSRIAQSSLQTATLLKFYPQPNFLANSRYNFQIPLVTHSESDGMQARVNRMLNTKNFVTGMIAYQRSSGSNPNLFGFVDTSSSAGLNSNASWRHTFAKMVFGTFTYNYSRSSSRNTPYFSGRENVSGDAGITGNDQEPGYWGPPNLSFNSGISGLSDGQLSLTRNQTHSVGGNVMWIRRPHNVTFGGDLRRLQLNSLAQQNPRGTFSFTGAETQSMVNGAAVPGTGFDFADFLLGVPDAASIAFGNADKYFRQGTYDLYVNDDFRALSMLTINVGIRWEYNAPLTEKYGRLVNLDVAPGFTNAAPVVANSPTGPVTHLGYPDSLLRPDKHAIQPRVGIAWHPFLGSSMLIRAGYGVTYDTSGYTSISNQMAQQSPLSKSLSVANTAANPLTMANAFHAAPGALTNTFAIDPDFHIGYSQSWQLSMQQDIPGSMVMTVTYLGIKGTRAVQAFLPNTYPAGVANPCATCQPGYTYMTSNGNSTRESGMLQLRRRFHSGIAASASYTYSKAIDDAALGGRGQGTSVIAQNWLDLAAERGLSPFDQRHVLSVQMQYSTGVGVHGGTLLSGWRGAVVKGWTITSNINTSSGTPLTPIYSQTVAGTGVVGPIRPLYTGADVYAASSGHFLNSAAYAQPLAGSWGNAGRDSIIGPNRFSLDGSMARTFSTTLDLRVDATNALNHVAYTSWVTNISSSQFGLPNPPSSMRSLKLTLRWRF